MYWISATTWIRDAETIGTANVSRDQLDPLLRQLRGVDDDDEDLLAFLAALSDGSFDRTTPQRVPSGLAVGGRIR